MPRSFCCIRSSCMPSENHRRSTLYGKTLRYDQVGDHFYHDSLVSILWRQHTAHFKWWAVTSSGDSSGKRVMPW
jgi:hypothetical protein